MKKLVNGRNFTTTIEVYDELSNKRKKELRRKIAQIVGVNEENAYKRIKECNFNPFELNAIYYETGLCFCPKQGFFLEPNVSKDETLNKYGLTL